MFSRNRERRRQVGRELITVLIAFAIAALLGKSILNALAGPPFFVTLLILVLLYALAYFALWRITDLVLR